ncbi:MAG: hypothetical protein K9J27_12435 [Bacteroidales bacterium]|nr:hypothetical protein [Bacteroidales bacterium]
MIMDILLILYCLLSLLLVTVGEKMKRYGLLVVLQGLFLTPLVGFAAYYLVNRFK